MNDDEKLYGLMAVAQEQQKAVQAAVSNLKALTDRLPYEIRGAAESALQGARGDLEKTAAKGRQSIEKAAEDAHNALQGVQWAYVTAALMCGFAAGAVIGVWFG